MTDPKDDALLRHDTPVDGPSPLVPEAVHGALARARVALAAAFGLEQPYAVWDSLRAEQLAARARHAGERRRLDEQGAFLLGAVRAAQAEATGAVGQSQPSDGSVTRGQEAPATGGATPAEGGARGSDEAQARGPRTPVSQATGVAQRSGEAQTRGQAAGVGEATGVGESTEVAEATGAQAPSALAAQAPAEAFLREGTARLSQARAELEATAAASEEAFAIELAAVQQAVTGHLERLGKTARPKLVLMLRALAGDRRILHLERLGGDSAVQLAWVLTGKLPSRYGFAFDDSTDDVAAAPPVLYPEEGVAAEAVRPTPAQLRALLEGPARVLPMKGMIPFVLPGGGGLVRLLQRGVVMELELADGEGFRNVLTVEEAERAAGHFVALQLKGALELELGRG